MSKKTKKQNKIYINDNNNNDDEIYIIKILIVGDPGVGKSNFIYRYTKDKFSSSNLSSAGFDSNSKEIEIIDKKVIVQLWDSAGQQQFKAITKNLFTRVQGIIILYDITNKETFLNVSNWIKLIQETNNGILYTLAGNKCDLKNERKVDEEEAIKYSKENNIDFLETSAKMNINIFECVNNFVQKIINSDYFIRNISFAAQNTSIGRRTINKNERCC